MRETCFRWACFVCIGLPELGYSNEACRPHNKVLSSQFIFTDPTELGLSSIFVRLSLIDSKIELTQRSHMKPMHQNAKNVSIYSPSIFPNKYTRHGSENFKFTSCIRAKFKNQTLDPSYTRGQAHWARLHR